MIYKITFITAFVFLLSSCSSYAPEMLPPEGYFEKTQKDDLNTAVTKYFQAITTRSKDGFFSISYSQTYGAFPFYEKSQVGEVFSELCVNRGGIITPDKKLKKMEPHYSFKNNLECANPNEINSGVLNFTHKNKTVYMMYSPESSFEVIRKNKDLLLRYEQERSIKIAKIKIKEKEGKRLKCLKDTNSLIKNVSEGDYTLQGLVVEVKDKVVLIQSSKNIKWLKLTEVLASSCRK